MKRGDVWQADLGAKSGRRPIVIFTRSAAIPYLNKVTVAEITSQSKGYPTEANIDQKANLPIPLMFSLIISRRFPNLASKNTLAHSTKAR